MKLVVDDRPVALDPGGAALDAVNRLGVPLPQLWLGAETGDPIRVSSRRGDLEAFARLTEAVRPGAIFIPFVTLAGSAASFLTNSAHDPSSKIPEYKVGAVRIEAVRAAVRASG
jgi:predicted molibdopterin-dependent oxidoreductase YjgC